MAGSERPMALALSVLVWLFAGCGRIGFVGVGADGNEDSRSDGDPWWNLDFRHRLKLAFQNAPGTEDLVGFQVLVVLDPSRIDFSQAQTAGEDIRFIDADGTTMLPHEIERWDPTRSFVWVRVPQLDAGTATDHIWLYFGDPTAADAQDREAVWSEYRGVWHLGEQGTGAPGEFIDSSPHRAHARGGGGITDRVPTPVVGAIGLAQNYDGVDDVISLTTLESAGFNFSVPALTLEFWIEPDPTRPDYNDTITLGGYNDGYRTGIAPSGTIGMQITGVSYDLDSAATVSSSAWHYFAGTYDGVTMAQYIDGVKDINELARPGNIDPSVRPLLLGRAGTTGAVSDYPLKGPLDEPRIANLARSTAWIAAQYRSMTDNLITFTAE